MKKYIVAFKPPDFVASVFQAAYARVTGRELPTENLHISLTYPFYLSDGYGEDWLRARAVALDFETISAWVDQLGVFEQDKRILYIGIEPENEIVKLHQEITKSIREGISFDLSVYASGELPTYLPHISLDYDFDGDVYTLESLRAEMIQAYFDIDELAIFGYDQKSFEEI